MRYGGGKRRSSSMSLRYCGEIGVLSSFLSWAARSFWLTPSTRRASRMASPNVMAWVLLPGMGSRRRWSAYPMRIRLSAYPRISGEASPRAESCSGTFRPWPKCGQALEFAIPGKPGDLWFGGELVAPGLVGVGMGLLQQELRDSQTGV